MEPAARNLKARQSRLMAGENPGILRQAGKLFGLLFRELGALDQMCCHPGIERQRLLAYLRSGMDAGSIRRQISAQRAQDQRIRLGALHQCLHQAVGILCRKLFDLVAQHVQLLFHIRGCQKP